jgi:hypothetical protein
MELIREQKADFLHQMQAAESLSAAFLLLASYPFTSLVSSPARISNRLKLDK